MTAPLVFTSMSANDTDVLVACEDETASSDVATQPRPCEYVAIGRVGDRRHDTGAGESSGDAIEKFHVAG